MRYDGNSSFGDRDELAPGEQAQVVSAPLHVEDVVEEPEASPGPAASLTGSAGDLTEEHIQNAFSSHGPKNVRRLVSTKAIECALVFDERRPPAGSGCSGSQMDPSHREPSACGTHDLTPADKAGFSEGDATCKRRMSEDAGTLTGCSGSRSVDKNALREQMKN